MILWTKLFGHCGIRWFFQPRSLWFSQVAEGRMFQNVQKVLSVAEKNDAAKGIADILSNGRMRRREGFSKFNKIYEYQCHMFRENVTVVMTSVSGHLLAHDFKMPFKKWRSCNPLLLFEAEIEKYCPDNYVDIKRTLEREVQHCQALVIWTDCDREGENIGYEIIHVCKAVQPNLQVFRARFSEITPRAIRNAWENLGRPDPNVNDAVEVRQELDLRIGASFTRFQTLRLQKMFPGVLAEQLISYGSCQFPTLGFVVERFKAIQAFVPEIFYRIKVTHDYEEGTVDFHWKRNRLFNHTACLVLYQICMEDPVATVVEIGSKPKSKWRPLPLDTVELEKLASRKLRINAKETMRIAEKLYTQGYISYPRTETNIFPKGMNLPSLVQLQTQDPHWGTFAQRILDQGGPNPRNGTKTDQAHPPIHPTKYAVNLQGDEQRLYEFIVRHFLACCSQDAKGQETTVEIDIANERFVAHGLMILARNYLEVYPYERWSDKVLPVYEKGSRFQPTSVEMVDGETSPPQLLTEADLISLMEKHGIGYDSMGYEMSKPDLRAELEADLKLICEGKKDKSRVLREQVQKYKQIFIAAVEKANKLDEALSQYFGEATHAAQEEMYPAMPDPVRKCPLCRSDMVLKTKKNGGFYLSCTGYPTCKSAVWFPDSVLEVSKDDSVCNVCRPHPVHRLKLKFKKGSLPALTPLEFVGCIGGCDEMLREILDLRYLQGPARPQPPADQPADPLQTGYSLNRPPARQDHHVQLPANVPTGPPALPARVAQNQTRQPDADNTIVCNCGKPAVLLTVRKDGPNQGRRFYKCSAGDCGFFLWSDPEADGGSNRAPGGTVESGRGRSWSEGAYSGGGDDGATCKCAQPSVLRTVQKEGANKGRQFHTCAKPREQQCGFFQWADENEAPAAAFPSSHSMSTGANPKRPSSDSSIRPSIAKRPRTCGICHQAGHTRKTCPQNR
ncbi:DNA topoisomerase 3-alpha isoform X2 [Sphaerodactylus townsendi]|uniref:DNA topoisomerase 3-alpha isoform X2 n=1 Tax=Sphaerodactylus townsendi TaxID=933632 RepID=UPI0020263A99|nr:DNA topoisomerase 3-alpha isoform X2 [Sphaerodactylus townsendi]